MKVINSNQTPTQGVSHNPEIHKKVLIPNGEIPNLTYFSLAVLSRGQSTKKHLHDDMYEIFFVTRGNGQIEVNGHYHELKTGTCVIVEPGENHVLENLGDEEMHLTYFGISLQRFSA